MLVCNACYCAFKKNGTLERTPRLVRCKEAGDDIGEEAEVGESCSYASCPTPYGSKRYRTIKHDPDGKGGEGRILVCNACY